MLLEFEDFIVGFCSFDVKQFENKFNGFVEFEKMMRKVERCENEIKRF